MCLERAFISTSVITFVMRILLLGGTGFVGRHLTENCLAKGHAVTLFHRGRSNASGFHGAEQVIGDRDQDIELLRGRKFDIVFDTSGYEVSQVRSAARVLAHSGLHYVFVSSISVYADFAHTEESRPVQTCENAETTPLSLANYGALKAACERALDEELGGQVRHVRAGLIIGPHDYDARFRYWLERIAQGGEVLAPGDPWALTQAIDVRDLVDWMITCAEGGRIGVCNATGQPMTMRERLETIRDVQGSNAQFVWASDDVLLAHGVGPYSEMPFWLPASLGARSVDIQRALAEGLTYRPFAQTVRDTYEWQREGWEAEAAVRENRKIRVAGGMTPEREATILQAIRANA